MSEEGRGQLIGHFFMLCLHQSLINLRQRPRLFSAPHVGPVLCVVSAQLRRSSDKVRVWQGHLRPAVVAAVTAQHHRDVGPEEVRVGVFLQERQRSQPPAPEAPLPRAERS